MNKHLEIGKSSQIFMNVKDIPTIDIPNDYFIKAFQHFTIYFVQKIINFSKESINRKDPYSFHRPNIQH